MSGLIAHKDNAEHGKPPELPWLEGTAAGPSHCVPDEDLHLEWIHGYSAQVGKSHQENLTFTARCSIVFHGANAKLPLNVQYYNML